MSGAFQTNREIFAHPIWKNIVDFRLFFLIYGNAMYSDGVRLADDLVLKRGEWCRSTRKIQEDLTYIENRQVKTYSTSVISRCIKRLVDMQMICTRSHELGTVFTVVNYDKHQGFAVYKERNLERNLEHSGNSGGTLGEHSGNNKNKVIKSIKEKKKEDTPPQFEEFWSEYPRRISKQDALKAWAKIIKDGVDPSEVITAAKNYADNCKVNSTEIRFIKHPASFINGDRWKDYLTPIISQSGTSYTNKMNDTPKKFIEKEVPLYRGRDSREDDN